MSRYADRDDLEARFGADNISLWATMSSGDSEATKTARINEAIDIASDEFEEIVRCTPGHEDKLPMTTAAIPNSVRDKVAIRAGLWLYGFMAVDDSPQTAGFVDRLEKRLDKWVDEVRAGLRKLDLQ